MSKFKSLFTQNIKSVIGGLCALLLPFLGSSSSLYMIYNYPNLVLFFEGNMLLFALATSLTMGLLLTPTTFVASISGYLFGLSVVPVVILAYTISSLIGFIVGKQLDGGRFITSITAFKKGEKFKKALEANPYWFVAFCRVSPVLPFGLMNLALPSLGVKLKPFVIAGTLGMIPRTLLFIWMGSTAKTIQEVLQDGGAIPLKVYLTLALVIVSTVGLFWVLKKVFR